VKKDFQIVTVMNRIPAEWYYLVKQCGASLKGEPCLVINYSDTDQWKGLNTKPKWLYRAIKDGFIPEKYMIFTDCWDVVFAAAPEEIIFNYEHFFTDIVISAEQNCFPSDEKDNFDKYFSETKYKYLNSGFIVGETEAILTCLEAMDVNNLPDDRWMPDEQINFHGNDQHEWQKIFLRQPVNMKLDRCQVLSQTLHDADIADFDFGGERIVNKITKSRPCAFHFNGGSKDNLSLREPILEKLKLNEIRID